MWLAMAYLLESNASDVRNLLWACHQIGYMRGS